MWQNGQGEHHEDSRIYVTVEATGPNNIIKGNNCGLDPNRNIVDTSSGAGGQNYGIEVINQTLAAHGLPRDQMAPREQAFADALVAAMLQVTGEIVGLALRRSFDLVTPTLEGARLAFPEGG